jgi:hypothetical protein
MREKISKARMRTPIAAVLAASLTAISAARAARGDVKDVKEVQEAGRTADARASNRDDARAPSDS